MRGTHDLIGDDMRLFRYIVDTARHTADLYGYDEMQTPIFEFSDVFHRSLGDTSDVVSKETYTFEDRGGESITLRPEFTAAIVRAFISNGYTQKLPFKAFYAGPAFRYERPQKGRQRQFHQVGVECLGADAPWHDVESILCAQQFLKELAGSDEQYYKSRNITLEINTIGDEESRNNYKTALINYFTKYKNDLSEESVKRLEKNPLRILDSKQLEDKKLVENAPEFEDYLNATSRHWFDSVTDSLSAAKCKFTISPRLVRGLDYYTHTVFEFTTDQLGAQATILAGGRYDRLIEQMGGSNIPGTGWASGVERLMLLDKDLQFLLEWFKEPVAINAGDENSLKTALLLSQFLREENEFKTEILYHKNYSKALKKADAINAKYFVRIENNKFGQTDLNLKDLNSGINYFKTDEKLHNVAVLHLMIKLREFSESLKSNH